MKAQRLAAAALLCVSSLAQAALLSRDIDGDGAVDAFYDPDANLSWQAQAGDYQRYIDVLANGVTSVGGLGGWELPSFEQLSDLVVRNLGNPMPGGTSPLPPFEGYAGSYWTSRGFVDDGGYYAETYELFTDTVASSYLFDQAGVWAVRYGDVPNISPVPEPTTWALMLAGFAALAAVLRRHRRHESTTAASRILPAAL